jgi:hypothetical protein
MIDAMHGAAHSLAPALAGHFHPIPAKNPIMIWYVCFQDENGVEHV